MRQIAMNGDVTGHLPRGVVILGLAVACWALVFGVGFTVSNIFAFISGAVLGA